MNDGTLSLNALESCAIERMSAGALCNGSLSAGALCEWTLRDEALSGVALSIWSAAALSSWRQARHGKVSECRFAYIRSWIALKIVWCFRSQ